MSSGANPTPPSAGPGAACPVDDPTQSCEPKPKLVSVAWLDGADATESGADGSQWVNLPRDAKWVDGADIKNLDRLTRMPRAKVRFDQPGSHPFKIKLVPDGGNLAYSAAEEGRNGQFLREKAEQSLTTDGDGTKVIENTMALAVCGTHKYSLEAKDNDGNKATSKVLEVWRRVFYFEAKMTGAATAASLATMTGEFANQAVKFTSAGSANITRMENIGTAADSATFKGHVKTAFDADATAKAKSPHIIIIGYTDHLAVKDSNQVVTKTGVTVGPGTAKISMPIVDASGSNKHLWQDIVTGESWFVSCEYQQNGSATKTAIAAASCTPKFVRTSMSREVEIDGTALPAGTGTITLTVNWVNRMRGGLSFPGTNLVCICTKAWWLAKNEAYQNQVMIHEIGHQFGMVADGSGTGPDKVATQYTGKGHVGSHCYNGCGGLASYSGQEASSTCVMFGGTNGKTAYCANCAPAMKKQDISNGFGSL